MLFPFFKLLDEIANKYFIEIIKFNEEINFYKKFIRDKDDKGKRDRNMRVIL